MSILTRKATVGSMDLLRLRPRRPRAATVFVLGGGGNLGAVQVGMLRGLLERGVLPDAVVGCSVGAINAAGIAADPTLHGVEVLEGIWTRLADRSIALYPSGRLSRLRLLTHRGTAIYSNDGLRALIDSALPDGRFEDLELPLHVVATELETGRERWFSEGPVAEPLLASAALPAVFPPVQIDGRLYTDGAVVNNVPIAKAYSLGADRVVVLHAGNFQRRRPTPRHPIDVLIQSFSVARTSRYLREVEEGREGVDLVVLPAIDPGKLRYDDFSGAKSLMARAHSAAASHLDALSLTAVGH